MRGSCETDPFTPVSYRLCRDTSIRENRRTGSPAEPAEIVPEAVAFECNGEETGTICAKAVENCIDQADGHAQKLYEVCPAFTFFAHRADSPLFALASPVFQVMGNARYCTIPPPYLFSNAILYPKRAPQTLKLQPGVETPNLVSKLWTWFRVEGWGFRNS